MFENNIQNIALGLGIGVVLAEFIVGNLVQLLETIGRCRLPDNENKAWGGEGQLVSHATGVLERLVYILLLVSEVSAAGAFIGTWILAKVATGWNMQQQVMQTDDIRLKGIRNRRAFIGLQGSLISLLFALLGAYLWSPASF